MAPTTKLWPINAHTLGKHIVLRGYLDAWLPIMGSRQEKIVFIDGFAGPGQYADGEDGSPIIAILALIEHAAKSRISATVHYLFVEDDPQRAEHLKERVEALRPQLPQGSSAHVHEGKFDKTLSELLDSAGASGKQLAPAFVMVDPFGVSETPMTVLAGILKNPRCELYVSFMYEAINRFRATPEFEQHLDDLFGTPEWRQGIDMEESAERRQFFYDLYTRQLKAAGAKHVVRFELFDGNRHVYTIFFATQHHVGCNRMKEAIWKAAPDGGYQFRASRDGQVTLFDLLTADLNLFREELRSKFAGQTVAIEGLVRWASGDGTVFHAGHLKRTLKAMEDAGEITVTTWRPKPRRRGTFADGSLITFVEAA